MPSIPVNTALGFIGFLLVLVGGFLLLAGLGIIGIEKITVKPGKPTWIIGGMFAIIGILLISFSEPLKQTANTMIPTSTPESSTTFGATETSSPPTAQSDTFNLAATYRIVSIYSNKVLAVDGGSQDDEAQIIQDTWRNWKHQLWKFEALKDGDEGYYYIHPVYNDKCLDVNSSNVNDGAEIIQYTCFQTNNQKWKIISSGNDYYIIQAKHSDKVLEISDLLDSTPVVQGENVEGKNQLWRIELVEQSPSSAPTPALGTPIITDVKLREETSENDLIIYQDVYFRDPDGDAYYTDWQVTSTTNPEIQVVNGTINSNSEQQMAGTFTTGTWTCGSGTYSVKFWVTILDRAGNESNGFEYTINCK